MVAASGRCDEPGDRIRRSVFASISTPEDEAVLAQLGFLPSKEADAGALADGLETFLLASFLTC